jgi:hypothetical protein
MQVAIDDLAAEAAQSVVDIFLAVVEQLKADPIYLEKLRNNFYGEHDGDRWTHQIGVRRVEGFADDDPPRDVWRFKIWELENAGLGFRFFYGYFDRTRTIVILGARSRDDRTYGFSSQFLERISLDYDRVHAAYG